MHVVGVIIVVHDCFKRPTLLVVVFTDRDCDEIAHFRFNVTVFRAINNYTDVCVNFYISSSC